nr:hypothetical protein [Tanacetum cinerariifolium]
MMHLMDIAAAIAAQKHSNRIVVTASVDNVSFRDPIRLGNVVTLQAQVTRAFSSSMEVHIDVWAEDIPSASTLAFLQNFYTDVTLYMPFEAHERTPAPAPTTEPIAAAVTAPVAAATPAPVAAPPVPAIPPVPVATAPARPAVVAPVASPALPTAGKLPSLASTGLTPPPIAPPAATAPEVPPYMLTTFSTLGDNAQGVVLLVRLPAEQFKKLPRNVFLNNLLKAINLVMADVVLVNVESPYPVALANLRKE